MDQSEQKDETPFNKYHLKDIRINPDTQKYKFDENFIKDSNANWKKQFAKHDIPDASEIIPSWFYLGNKINISDKSFLQEIGITHILNVSNNLPCYFPNDFIYAQIDVDDTPSHNIGQFFDAATGFIDEINPKYNKSNQDQHLKLFVHCAVGKSRSSTIVIQYLMRRGINFANALWLQKMDEFGLINNFMHDDKIYKRSLQCFNIGSVLCCNCCICWFKCCMRCNCCNETNIISLLDDEMKIECDDKYKDWKAMSNIGTMSYRNSCDYVQKCREIICPNQSFATQLAEFEEFLRNGVSTYKLCYAWQHNYGCAPKRYYKYDNSK